MAPTAYKPVAMSINATPTRHGSPSLQLYKQLQYSFNSRSTGMFNGRSLSAYLTEIITCNKLRCILWLKPFLRCFDTIGWARGRASAVAREVGCRGGSGCFPNFYIGEQPIILLPQYLHTEYPSFKVNYINNM